jgi:hypothetical protein
LLARIGGWIHINELVFVFDLDGYRQLGCS